MPNTIKPKRSYTAGRVPTTSDLAVNEICINYADKILYVNQAGTIVSVPLGGGSYTLPTATADILGGVRVGSGLSISSGVLSSSGLTWSSVPASPTATGTAGQIAYDANNNLYLCVASNSWVRYTGVTWDTQFSNVTLLLHGDGTIADSSSYARVLTAYGGASASGAAKFGSGALSFTNTGDYFTVPDSDTLELGSGDFTLEAWIYPTAYPVNNVGSFASGLLCKLVSGPDYSFNWALSGTASSFTALTFQATDSSTPNVMSTFTASTSFLLNTWAHVAVVRSGSLIYFYKDGNLLNAGGTSFTINIRNGTTPLRIGQQGFDSSYVYQFFGRMDEVRITKAARYTGSTYAVPTAAFPNN